MLGPFIGQNIHFAVGLAGALTCFAAAWLNYDSYNLAKKAKVLWKVLGFISLSVAFLLYATVTETTISPTGYSQIAGNTSILLRFIGYLALIIGSLIDPLQKVPQIVETPAPPAPTFARLFVPITSFAAKLAYALPLGAFANAWFMFRRSGKGLERHLRPLIVVFFAFGLFETASLARLFRSTQNIVSYSLVKSFGIFWIGEHLFLLVGAIILGVWLWQYLVTRLEGQLTLLFTTATLVIFLLTSTTFTFTLLNSVQQETLENLKINSKVINYTLDSKATELKSNAEAFAESKELGSAVSNRDRTQITNIVTPVFTKSRITSLVVTSAKGEVLVRSENSQLWGDSLSSDALVKKALAGQSHTGLISKSDVASPRILVQAISPIYANGKLVGTISMANAIDNNFLDGLKKSTGLDSAIFANNVRSATTLVGSDGKNRLIGLAETNKAVQQTVLKDAKTYSGNINVIGVPYSAVYTPLFGSDGTPIGMVFAGQPQSALIGSASKSIEVTLISASVLLVLSGFVWYFVAKYLKKQMR